MKRRSILLALSFVLLFLFNSAPTFAQGAKREITRIAGDVFRFKNNFHYSVFAVTSEGVIVTDPINPEAARWLKTEIKKRFGKPIRFVIYSHDHRDHIAGGEIFADSAVIIAHERAKEVILGEKRPTAVPHLTFKKSMTIELGGTKVELHHVGRNHSDNMIVMRFPKERILYAVDFIPVRSVAFRDFPDAYMPDWIQSLKQVEGLDFDILAPGHGPMGKKEHVAMFREFLEDLQSEVLKHARAGRTLEETKRLVKMEQYKDWGGYERMFQLNIEGMYRMVQSHRRGN